MKKHLFFVFTLITIALSLKVPAIKIGVSDYEMSVAGAIGIPIVEFILLFIYLPISKHYFHITFNFKFNKLLLPFKSIYYGLLIIFPVIVIVVVNITTSKPIGSVLKDVPNGQIWLAVIASLISAVLTGCFEELTFRGGILGYISVLFENKKNGILYSILISSLLFSLSHLNNIGGGQPLYYTFYQIIYAFSFGFCMSIVYIKFGTILLPILLHAISDWSDFFFNMTGEPTMKGIEWSPILIFLVFLISGILLYKKINPTNTKDFIENFKHGLEN